MWEDRWWPAECSSSLPGLRSAAECPATCCWRLASSKEIMTIRSALKQALMGAVLVGLAFTAAQAQWSIGAPGKREAAVGKHRYAFLVFANPIPGREAEFNDWYTSTHMGDLLQLAGWVGGQRFRIVTTVQPRPSVAGYGHGYLMIWDLEETEANAALSRMTAAISGGKSRRGAAFYYTAGAGASGAC